MPAKGSRSQRFGWSRQARCLRKCGWPSYPFEYGAAHGALASTTPGDTSMATRKEVEKVMAGGGARVVR
jgi:hypothetical protein